MNSWLEYEPAMPERTATRVYFDSNIFVYAMEKDDDDALLARRWLMQAERSEINAVTSELTFAEVLPLPLARENNKLVDGYKRLLRARASLDVVAVGTSIILKAAELRAHVKIDLADALHVATAIERACEGFLTNDHRLKVVDPLRKLALADARYPL